MAVPENTGVPHDQASAPEGRRGLSGRRPLRIRTILIALLVIVAVAVPVGFPVYCQRVAIREVKRLNGVVATRPLTGPEWLQNWLNEERIHYFDEVLGVQLNDVPVTETVLASLSRLDSVQYLSLRNSQLTDAGLVHVGAMTGLQKLWLDDTPVTDAGLVHLKTLKKLRWLSLINTRITDEGLVNLAGLTELKLVLLDGTPVTGRGIAHLKGLNRLEWLWLDNTAIADDALEQLRGLSGLVEVSLKGTQVSAAAIGTLQQALPTLRIGH